MIYSCLVQPLVSGRGRAATALTRTRVLATALACSALLAVGGAPAEVITEAPENQVVHRNAHQKPESIPYQTHFQVGLPAAREDQLIQLTLAPDYDQVALHKSRLRRGHDPTQEPSTGTNRASWRARILRAWTASYHLFASASPRSAFSETFA